MPPVVPGSPAQTSKTFREPGAGATSAGTVAKALRWQALHDPAPAWERLPEWKYGLRQRRAQRSSGQMSSVAMVFGCLAFVLAIF